MYKQISTFKWILSEVWWTNNLLSLPKRRKAKKHPNPILAGYLIPLFTLIPSIRIQFRADKTPFAVALADNS